ncbi:glycosyltransferase [Acetobacter nitrogenifigens DSM 23921 = NBRC 105050]|uniref:Glycosyl transferase n=1 Tax=Acetobacter nitrogenifigens DSM 23921 = NBRC 105050 TaxID=1120919 RepID=A0A511X5Q2_9PROT|nr:glycosyltransferase [Acetobacter nitrogenifigens]GBQ98339.1 glycosyltransferase [Acetobacter nitrogenifigens DSM 23921 = NBRC 105050]GEN58245.1 glycosyl transferase [Acetobacter nitrogenifigens DSM 23921 = NBRC 105050]
MTTASGEPVGASSLRVAHVMAGAPAGGAELFFERLCIAQAASGLNVLPVIRRDVGRVGRLRAAGLSPRELRFGGQADLLTRPRMKSALCNFGAEVVVAWMNRAARFAPKGQWTLVGRLGGYYDLSYYRNCDHLIGNTRGLAEWMVSQGWAADRVHYVPNFATDFSATAPRRPKEIPENAPFLLALGRLHENKAFDVLIRAMPRLPGARLLIAGEGPQRAMLEDLARQVGVADRVLMPGWADPGGLIRACDILVCPSRHEPLGNVVIEAFSAATPVVAAASEGPRELIVDGANGLLAPVEDHEALAQAIGAVIEDRSLAQRLALGGRISFESDYAPAPVLNAWNDFLRKVAPRTSLLKATA